MHPNFGITRVQQMGRYGWVVRLYHPGKNKTPASTRYFSDTKYGGSEKTLETARTWRDAEMLKHGITPRKRDGSGFMVAYHRDNRFSNRIGINLIVERNKSGSFRTLAWQARLMVEGRQKTRSFSIMKYGYEKAWSMAAAVRQAHDGQPIPESAPEKPDWMPDF